MNIDLRSENALYATLRSCTSVDAAVLYGSVARGDAEAYSDIDLLIVCDENLKAIVYDDVRSKLSPYLKRLSLCVYGHKELRFLARVGSLFLLHLNREGRILFDRSGVLDHILSSFEPKSSYDEDFSQSIELIEPLKTAISGAPNNLHRLAYVYSLFRVYGVYLLARDRIFEFSKTRMTTMLVEKYPSLSGNIVELSRLRVLNTNFFTGQSNSDKLYSAPMDFNVLVQAGSALGELVGKPLRINEQPYGAAVTDFINASKTGNTTLLYKLRSWFLLLVYDGLNIYARKRHKSEITSFSENTLRSFTSRREPEPVIAAASQSLSYIRNFHIKYSFSEEQRIRVDDACRILEGLAIVA